jgi:hypothetical protein
MPSQPEREGFEVTLSRQNLASNQVTPFNGLKKMAKPGKPSHRIEPEMDATRTESAASEAHDVAEMPDVSAPAVSVEKKDLVQTRPKKPSVPVPKNGSRLPSAHKLEHLKAAVTAAGSADKLLLILQHVEEAGGKAEITESIEAYRVLKTVLEE